MKEIFYTVDVNSHGAYWYRNGNYHRANGPAAEHANGTKEWWLNDKRHRTNGPAQEYFNGNKYWYLNDKLHRTNGPAVEWSNGDKAWYLNGIEYSLNKLIFRISLNSFCFRSNSLTHSR